jgi:hypothetical protein
MCLWNTLDAVLCVEIFRFIDYVNFRHMYNWDITERLFYYESFDLDLRKSFFIGGVYTYVYNYFSIVIHAW